MNGQFNKTDLITRIKLIRAQTKNICLYNKDAIESIDETQQEAKDTNMVFYFDPPYYLKAI